MSIRQSDCDWSNYVKRENENKTHWGLAFARRSKSKEQQIITLGDLFFFLPF